MLFSFNKDSSDADLSRLRHVVWQWLPVNRQKSCQVLFYLHQMQVYWDGQVLVQQINEPGHIQYFL